MEGELGIECHGDTLSGYIKEWNRLLQGVIIVWKALFFIVNIEGFVWAFVTEEEVWNIFKTSFVVLCRMEKIIIFLFNNEIRIIESLKIFIVKATHFKKLIRNIKLL